MPFWILALTLLLPALPLTGCAKPTSGSPTPASPQEKASDREIPAGKAVQKIKTRGEEKDRDDGKKTEKPADSERSVSSTKTFEKWHIKWSDPKESDFPLIITVPSANVPGEIKGPFPDDAPWRTQEKTPEKKSAKGVWPWN